MSVMEVIFHWKMVSERCAINSEIHYPWDRAHQWMLTKQWENTIMGRTLEERTENLLHVWAPYYKEPNIANSTTDRFRVTCTLEDYTQFTIWDQYRGQVYTVSQIYLEDPNFNLIKWYQQCMIEANEEASYHVETEPTRWPSFLPLVNWMLSD